MASSGKQPIMSSSSARRKSSKGSHIITLHVSPKSLANFPADAAVKEESPLKDVSSPTTSDSVAVAPSGNPSESAPNTPAAVGTPNSSMPPPSEGIKKKGVKRSSAAALGPDAPPKVRGKPGPKKKARLEDGTIDHSSSAARANASAAAHKLGPKANQGAINAGLRALDRSGKPCRKWNKGGFKLKSFTGVVWELHRWTAPPKPKPEEKSEEPASGESGKENKDNSQLESEKSNNGVDVEMTSPPSQAVGSSRAPSAPPAESSPAPVITVAAPA